MIVFQVIFWMCVAAACAGYVGTPLAYSAAPLVYSAPSSYAVPAAYVKSYPLATSYANTYKVNIPSINIHPLGLGLDCMPIYYVPFESIYEIAKTITKKSEYIHKHHRLHKINLFQTII